MWTRRWWVAGRTTEWWTMSCTRTTTRNSPSLLCAGRPIWRFVSLTSVQSVILNEFRCRFKISPQDGASVGYTSWVAMCKHDRFAELLSKFWQFIFQDPIMSYRQPAGPNLQRHLFHVSWWLHILGRQVENQAVKPIFPNYLLPWHNLADRWKINL